MHKIFRHSAYFLLFAVSACAPVERAPVSSETPTATSNTDSNQEEKKPVFITAADLDEALGFQAPHNKEILKLSALPPDQGELMLASAMMMAKGKNCQSADLKSVSADPMALRSNEHEDVRIMVKKLALVKNDADASQPAMQPDANGNWIAERNEIWTMQACGEIREIHVTYAESHIKKTNASNQ